MSNSTSEATIPSTQLPVSTSGKFPRNFWVINTIEMFERLAYYTITVVVAIYICQADEPGGLRLTQAHRGIILFWWSMFQSMLPIITGGLADRFGYKRVLTCALTTMMLGYLCMAFMRDIGWLTTLYKKTLSISDYPDAAALHAHAVAQTNFWLFLFAVIIVAGGTAFFKPSIQGALSNTLNKQNSSVGWGVFYWIVNVGAFIGHYLPNIILGVAAVWFGLGEHSAEAWRNLFLACAGATALNLVTLCFMKDVPSGAPKNEPVLRVLWRTFINVFEPRLLCWILIMSGFWMMMYQLWDSQPNFITDWMDSSHVAIWMQNNLPGWMANLMTAGGTTRPHIPQEVWLSINSLCIILGVILVAWLTRKMKTLSAMLIGMFAVTIGLLVAGATMNVGMLALGIVFFSIGEMSVGPKKSEYLSLIAPPGKKALYLGYINIPAGLGKGFGALISGYLYGHFSEKATLALRYLAENTNFLETTGKTWNGDIATLSQTLGIPRDQAMVSLQSHLGQNAQDVTKLLWDTYSPHLHLWLPFAGIGVIAITALFIFARMARRWSDMDA